MIEIKIGDCVDRLKDLDDNSVDAIISDPPYGLKFMSKGWDDIGEGSQQREWHRKWLTEAYRVLKPNGVLKAFSGTRTYHHLIAMVEEIGFKDLRVEAWASKEAHQYDGWGTALKPAWEAVCIGFKR